MCGKLTLKHLKFENKVASGSYGDLYKGTYYSQEVAIKILKPERVNSDLQKEFAQEVYIMRKVRHKNVVQFIGACTKLPSLLHCIQNLCPEEVSMDYLHKQRGCWWLRVADFGVCLSEQLHDWSYDGRNWDTTDGWLMRVHLCTF
ncbi:Serine/threonine-protein kinaseY46 [Populus alba x Populus x berolinensis]|nr:Serine/threonine-protein kinaseY46 [Populus alba x Populus x berolinensis]